MTEIHPPPRTGRLIVPFQEWPDRDQTAWRHNCSPADDPFDDDPRPGAERRADTLASYKKGYGRWLSFLASRGWLDPAQPADARVTRPRLRCYFRVLKRSGNRDQTIVDRFNHLASTIGILIPGADIGWIQRPDGATIRSQLACDRRSNFVPPASDVLYKWGLSMMEKAAQATPATTVSCIAYRNGLLIAMLAARARRLRSMQLLRVGHELLRSPEGYRIELTPDQVKTNKPDRFELPTNLTPYIEHYLRQLRPQLLAGRHSEHLWINKEGVPLTSQGIQTMIKRATLKRFSVSFGPHAFRHAAATTAALRDPACPNLASSMLGISPEIAEGHYNRAGQIQAAKNYAAMLEKKFDR